MPIAPVAKGLIFSLSLLIAAGIAVYDNPQVREWIDQSRRKIALAFNGINDDPRRPNSSRIVNPRDASTTEDSSPEATERRRQAREEILQRRRLLEERRGARTGEEQRKSSSSFDQLVNSDGSLREKEKGIDLEAMAAAITTAAESIPDEGLRKRTTEAVGVAMGSAAANPFADEMGIDSVDEKALLEQMEPFQSDREKSTTIRGDSPSNINTASGTANSRADDGLSSHDSELLVDLTPTTSIAPSVSGTLLSSPAALTPASTNHPNSQPHEEGMSHQPQLSSFQSIQEWASAASMGPASFYSPPESERHYRDIETSREVNSQATSTTASVIGTNDIMSEGMDDVDTVSDAERVSGTPSTWSEIDSVASDE